MVDERADADERRKKEAGWYFDFQRAVEADPRIKAAVYRLLLTLARRANLDGRVPDSDDMSNSGLQRLCRMSENTIIATVKAAEDLGWLKVKRASKRDAQMKHIRNHYQLTCPVEQLLEPENSQVRATAKSEVAPSANARRTRKPQVRATAISEVGRQRIDEAPSKTAVELPQKLREAPSKTADKDFPSLSEEIPKEAAGQSHDTPSPGSRDEQPESTPDPSPVAESSTQEAEPPPPATTGRCTHGLPTGIRPDGTPRCALCRRALANVIDFPGSAALTSGPQLLATSEVTSDAS